METAADLHHSTSGTRCRKQKKRKKKVETIKGFSVFNGSAGSPLFSSEDLWAR